MGLPPHGGDGLTPQAWGSEVLEMRHTEHEEGFRGPGADTGEKAGEQSCEEDQPWLWMPRSGMKLRAGSARGSEVAPGKVGSNLKSKDRPCFYMSPEGWETIGVDEGQTHVVQRRNGTLELGWAGGGGPSDWREEGGEKPRAASACQPQGLWARLLPYPGGSGPCTAEHWSWEEAWRPLTHLILEFGKRRPRERK